MRKKALKMCYDKILPRDLNRKPPQAPPRRGGGPQRAILVISKMWVNGSTLSVRFMDGTSEQHDLVQQFAPEWSEFANIRFDFDGRPDAEIRISFDANDGAWSYVGKDALEIPVHAATMNLGWVDKGVVLHEFGHALGLGHEHQNPDGGIQWNEETVYRDLAGPPNFWSRPKTFHNVIRKYDLDHIRGTDFDGDSVMLYAFPGSWTLNMPQGTHENNELSADDKQFIGSDQGYPSATTTEIVELQVARPQVHAAEIGMPGEEDLFRFDVTEAGEHTIETEGPTDLVMSLFGPDSQTNLVAWDDDSGAGYNSRIVADLAPGTYYVQVRHYSNATGTGEYSIQVSAR